MSREPANGPPTLCVTNAKGGTGKTTVAINVAGALNDRGHDVLFVDLDPQGNATEGLGLLEAYNAEPPTLFDVLTNGDRRPLVNDLVVEHPEMDVVPSNIDMLQAERELTIADLVARVKDDPSVDIDPAALSSLGVSVSTDATAAPHALDVVERTLAALDHEYDYAIIDSPPFYGKLTDAGVFAARNILVPALAEASSERAIELLLDQMAALEEQTDISVDIVGVVANRVETTNEDREMVEWFNTVFPDAPVWEVRKRVALQRAFSAGESIFRYDQSVDMEDVFLDVAADIEERLGRKEMTA